jgi:hypothetical protein
MLESLPMSTATYDELRLHVFEPTDDPEVRGRQRMILDWALGALPEEREKLEEKAELRGELQGERRALRRLMKARRLALVAEDEARIDACTDRDTLERWLDQAAVAKSVAEALR